MLPVMKKLYRIFSIILAVTILVGVGWYFFPAAQVKSGAQGIKNYVDRVASNFNNDNVQSEGVKVDDTSGGDYGDLGESLSFNSSSSPYRELLSVKQKGVYNQIYANARDCAGTFKLVCALSVDELSETYIAVICDNPELFWLDNSYQYGYATNNKNTAIQMTLKYNALKQNLSASKSSFEAAAKEIIDGAGKYTDAYSKEKYVFEALAQSVGYNDNASCNQTAYSALVGRSTVCAGYARALQYVLNELGIPCYYVFGKAGSVYHAWNIVQLGGEWYGVDLTWSDQDTGLSYTYFNVTDATLSANHTRSAMSEKLPYASGTKYAYTSEQAVKPSAQSGTGSKDQVSALSSMDEYNAACYSQIVSAGEGRHTFTIVLSGTDLYDEVLAAANRGDYEAGYLRAAADELGIEKYNYSYNIDGDSDDTTGIVTLTQTYTLRNES
jgi:hypothetical protein